MAFVAGGGGMCVAVGMYGKGMHGRGWWQGGMHAGEMATEAGSTHPTEMHSFHWANFLREEDPCRMFGEEKGQFPNSAIPIRVEAVAVHSALYVQQWATGSIGADGAT